MNTIEFLQQFHPDRAWVLTAIEPNQKGIETKAFLPGQEVEAQKWVDGWDNQRNMYYSVAEVKNPEDKKAGRENIAAVHAFHVDIDAEGGKDLMEELARIKRLVTTNLPAGVPKPTVAVFSGGGYQAFWILKNPIVVDGKLPAADEAARFNKQLEAAFGADACSNVDRIMRLPGTQNVPNQRKLAKGRRQVEAKVLYFVEDRTYEISDFTQAADVATTPSTDSDIDIGGNVQRLATVDDLDEWGVPDRVKVIIVQGHDPDNPKEGDDSRSAWVFDCACQLVRAEVPNDVIYSVLTDPDFKIADSIRENNNPHKYCIKQIKSAKEAAISENLQKLNSKFAVIGNLGGKCRVIEEVYDDALKRERLVKQSFEDFKNRHMNQREPVQVGDKVKMIPVGKWWLEHPQRRQFDRLIFAPGQEIDGTYNLWRGFSVPALPGTGHESFLEHIENNICNGDRNHYKFLLQWLAKAVQEPAQAGEIAFVMRGSPGTGKSFFAKNIGYLFGRHFLHVSNAAHLVGNFNSHLRDAIVVFGDEAFYAGDKKHESVLKTLITEQTLIIEAKGVDAEACPNYTHLIMASNSEWVVPVGAGDRRYFVVDVKAARARDQQYFGGIQRDLDNGGFSNLLHHLLREVDTTSFRSQNIPNTSAGDDQKALSLEPHEEWWFNTLHEGRLGPELWTDDPIPSSVIWDSYLAFTESYPVYKRIGRIKLSKFLSRVGPEGSPVSRVFRTNGELCRGHIYAPLEICREIWNTKYATRTEWDEIVDTDDGDLPF